MYIKKYVLRCHIHNSTIQNML